MKALSKMLILSMLMAFSINSFSQNAIVAPVLSEKDQQTSNQFKSLASQDRVALFIDLQHLIKIKASSISKQPINSNMIGVTTTTASELVVLLGNPTRKINNNTFYYNLKGNANTCQVVIKVDKDGFVVFCTIKNCN